MKSLLWVRHTYCVMEEIKLVLSSFTILATQQSSSHESLLCAWSSPKGGTQSTARCPRLAWPPRVNAKSIPSFWIWDSTGSAISLVMQGFVGPSQVQKCFCSPRSLFVGLPPEFQRADSSSYLLEKRGKTETKEKLSRNNCAVTKQSCTSSLRGE